MELLIDNAELNTIKKIYEIYPVDGVTTNPTILSKTQRNPYEVLREIRAFIGNEAQLHVQVISSKAEDMIEEAHEILKELGRNTYIKIPCIEEGFKAMKALHSEGIHITATVVYAPMQAYLAAKCGADYVAPYVNRIDNLGYDGIATVQKIQNILECGNYKTKILGASFKNCQQVIALAEYGIEAVTLSPDVFSNLVKNPAVDAAVESFVCDFEKANGKGKTMLR